MRVLGYAGAAAFRVETWKGLADALRAWNHALDEAWRSGRVGPGSTVVVCGFGGGLAWGSAVWRL